MRDYIQAIGGRKYTLVIIALALAFVLAPVGKLDATAGVTLTGLAGLYFRYNVKQKTDLAQTAAEAQP